jgi:hypothetical protein
LVRQRDPNVDDYVLAIGYVHALLIVAQEHNSYCEWVLRK